MFGSMIRKIRNEKGLSMLEAMLGLMVVSVGFLGMMPLMTSATANTLSTDRTMTSTYLAGELIETMIADKQYRGYNYLANSNYPAETMTGSLSQYVRTVNITEVSKTDLSTASVGSGYKKIDVTVTWNGTRTVVVTTLLTTY